MNVACIYRIVSKIKPEKQYIGSACHFGRRKREHFSKLKLNQHHSPILQSHANKYGVDDLEMSIVEIVADKNNLIAREQFYFDTQECYFNSSKTARSCLGIKRSAEYIERMAASKRGRKLTDEQRRRISIVMKGRIVTEETRKKMSLSMKGRKQSAEHIRKLSLIRKGKRPSQETRKKMSAALKRRHQLGYVKNIISDKSQIMISF